MGEWIKCSDRMPSNSGWVIVLDDSEVTPAWYRSGRFAISDDDGDDLVCYPSHWMPLPEPPEVE